MKDYPYILFDLDGTLVNSGPGITRSVAYALEHLGINPPEDLNELSGFVGPPLKIGFSKYYHLSSEDVTRAIALYREYYRIQGMFECQVYDGIPTLLNRLRNAGRTLLVATSKPERYAVPILQHLGLSDQFVMIAGADDDRGLRSEKQQVIRYAMDTCAVSDPDQIMMVGDTEYDVIGAKALGIQTLGVLYGFGSKELLQKAGATWFATTPEQVGDIILNTIR